VARVEYIGCMLILNFVETSGVKGFFFVFFFWDKPFRKQIRDIKHVPVLSIRIKKKKNYRSC